LRACGGGFLNLGGKGAGAATPEEQLGLCSILAPHPPRKIEESAVQHRAVIVGDCDKPGFLHETTQLDQMPREFASCHYPSPRV
jgi:hypothetical protein